MTIVIAIKDTKKKQIILGSDKRATRGGEVYTCSDKIITLPIKIINGYEEEVGIKPLYICISGHMFLSSFLKYGFKPPKISEQQNFMEYLYEDFLPLLKELLHDDNLIEVDNNVSNTESGFIFVFDGEICFVDYRLSVTVLDNDFFVEGSGREIALGSIYTNLNYHKDMDYKDIVEQAIKTCGKCNCYCDDKVNLKVISYD